MQILEECPICNSARLASVTEQHEVPVHQNMLFDSPEAARRAIRGHLKAVACLSCDFVFNAAFDAALMSYGAGYESDQTYSSAFTSHVDKLLNVLLNEKSVRDSRIIEVGCGKGDFLRSLVEAEGSGNSGWGFDPSYGGVATDVHGRLNYVRDFYGDERVKPLADVAIVRHVIEHVPDPRAMLAQILRGSPDVRIFMETKDVDWVLRTGVIWDFFYEYCSYFSARSISRVFHEVGIEEINIDPIFGGQYLWIEAPSAQVRQQGSREDNGDQIEETIAEYIRLERQMRARWEQTIHSICKRGEIALWGAGAKGGTFASLFDPQAKLISCVVDLNPAKQGRFIAGSAHPILAPSHLKALGVTNVILMNPNYLPEVRELLTREGIDVNVVTDPELPEAAHAV